MNNVQPIDVEIYALRKLKLTESEIGKKLNLKQSRVSYRLAKLNRWLNPKNKFYRGVSVRLANCLRDVGFKLESLDDLKEISKKDVKFFMKIRNFGNKSLKELNSILENYSLPKLKISYCKTCGRELPNQLSNYNV